MRERSLIKRQIISAWESCINDDYCSQRINSERSLQASFWAHLNVLLGKNRRLFIEPSMTMGSGTSVRRLYPDIVVCNSRSVIAVVELKYTPKGSPRYKKDVRSLASIAVNRSKIKIANSRFRGNEQDSRGYHMPKNVLFVWAGVHSGARSAGKGLYSVEHRSLKGCYLELHAQTASDDAPDIYYYQG